MPHTQPRVSRSKPEMILAAALERFARYGFRRTSVDDIARAAGMSRAAIYLHFKNKEEIFRALAQQLQERALAAAQAAAREAAPFDVRLRRILEAKMAALFEALHGSAHASELLDENNRICGDISAAAARRYLKLLTEVISTAVRRKELAPKPAGLNAAAAAELVVQCAEGIKSAGSRPLPPALYRRRLAQFVRVFVTGLGGTAS